MKILSKLFFGLVFWILTFNVGLVFADGIDVTIPAWLSQDGSNSSTSLKQEDTRDWTDIFSLTNDLLWFSMGILTMAWLLYGWWLLLSGQWDEDKFKQANNILIYGWIGLFIALSAYVIVRYLVTLY